MNKNNWVNIVGYQLEKIHTGVIKWLLDTDSIITSSEQKIEILNNIYRSVDCKGLNVKKIVCTPEYSFGRKLRIDLLIEMTADSNKKYYIIIECKTDSDISLMQLENIIKTFKSSEKGKNAEGILYALFLFGASIFTIDKKVEKTEFKIFKPIDILNCFGHLPVQNQYYKDWICSLKEEIDRQSNIRNHLKQYQLKPENLKNDDSWRKHWMNKGYRIGFPLYYTVYNTIKEEIEKLQYKGWEIYSASNNPVLNWWNEWLEKRDGNLWKLYWEFNFGYFKLKASDVADGYWQKWLEEKEEISKICDSCKIKGTKAQNKEGKDVSAYKWDMDFWETSIDEIVSKVYQIISYVHPRLIKDLGYSRERFNSPS